jgi:NSS family neurotransmitter:Na+ symporter
MTFFDFVDYVSQNIMLPLGGLLIAVFAAWFLPKQIANGQLGIRHSAVSVLWRLLGGVIAPLCVAAVFTYTLFPEFVTDLFD